MHRPAGTVGLQTYQPFGVTVRPFAALAALRMGFSCHIASGCFVFQQVDQPVVQIQLLASIPLHLQKPVCDQRLQIDRCGLPLGDLRLHHIGNAAVGQTENRSTRPC